MEQSSAVWAPDGGPRSDMPAVRLIVPVSAYVPDGTYTAVGVAAARAASHAAVKAVELSVAPVESAPKSTTLKPNKVGVIGAAASVAPARRKTIHSCMQVSTSCCGQDRMIHDVSYWL